MINLGALAMPEKIDIDFPSIKFYSKYTDLLIAITQHEYKPIYVLNIVWLYIRESHGHFYYRYDISTNFYKTKDEQTGIDSIVIRSGYPSGIRIFLGRNYI